MPLYVNTMEIFSGGSVATPNLKNWLCHLDLGYYLKLMVELIVNNTFSSLTVPKPRASNKLGEWLSDMSMRFSPWASLATVAVK